ncbi:four helix bundle protein [Candidatus Sumerlaeota bacterium]|nr:four helix bundle protein [Candidatus Sumerlaeota bacterium]
MCADIAEAWRKRRHVSHFVSKLRGADSEAAEVVVWLDFALLGGYGYLRACLETALNPSLRGAKRRSNPSNKARDCFASLAMTGFQRSFWLGELVSRHALTDEDHSQLLASYKTVSSRLARMTAEPEKWCEPEKIAVREKEAVCYESL